jgi:hypothetical protein
VGRTKPATGKNLASARVVPLVTENGGLLTASYGGAVRYFVPWFRVSRHNSADGSPIGCCIATGLKGPKRKENEMPLPKMGTAEVFPVGGADPDLQAFAKEAITDGRIRTLPESAESKTFLAQLRGLTDEANRKLKTRLTNGVYYFQVLKEAPVRRKGSRRENGNGTATPTVAAPPATVPTATK